MRVRLDRAVVDSDWMSLFPNYQVHHLTSSRYDHCPVLVRLQYNVNRQIPVRRYETYWERESSLAEDINDAWSMHIRPKDLGDVSANLKGVMESLHAWSRKTIGSVPKEIEKLWKIYV